MVRLRDLTNIRMMELAQQNEEALGGPLQRRDRLRKTLLSRSQALKEGDSSARMSGSRSTKAASSMLLNKIRPSVLKTQTTSQNRLLSPGLAAVE